MKLNFIQKIRKKIRKSINYLLNNRNDYFTCFYSGKKNFILSVILNYLSSKIRLDPKKNEQLCDLNKKGIVVYTGKYKSFFEFFYYHTALKKAALPYPEIGFDFSFFLLLSIKRIFQIILSQIDFFLHNFKLQNPYSSGYINTELLRGRSGFLFLIESKAFYKRFVKASPDPLLVLIDLQKKIKKPIFLVPQVLVFSLKPIHTKSSFFDVLLGNNEKPGKLKRFFTIFKNPDKINVEISEPVNLKEFLQKPNIKESVSFVQAHYLRNHLIDLSNTQKKSIIGPVLKSREELTEDILTQTKLQTFMKKYAKSKKEPLLKTHKRAASYINEIAASYNPVIVYIADKILTWTFKNIFEGLVIDKKGLDRIKEASKKAPLILMPCHKSHIDYLLLSYVMYKNNMPCPQIAAGKNLSFWPLGYLFRNGGAFFLRRTFKGAVLYSKIFSAYIEKLLFEGFNIEFFIEGGRSRSGKLLSPKLGFLSMLINAYANKACDDLFFVPVYVGYDRVIEENAYLHEIEGGKKTKENFSQLIKARKFLKKKYGKVYIKFDEPVSLSSYIREKKIDMSYTDTHKNLCKSIGYKLINSINSIGIVTPYGIVSSAILNYSGNRFTKKQLMFQINSYMTLLKFFNVELADTLIIDPDIAFTHVLKIFINRKLIEFADESENEITLDTRFIIKDNKRPILYYYKNNAICFFVSAAYTAIAILEALEKNTLKFSADNLNETYNFLQNFFIDEFSFDEDKTCKDHINLCLKVFTQDGIIESNPSNSDIYNITFNGLKKLKSFSYLLNSFFESYKIVLFYFEKYPENKHNPKERIKKIQSKGLKMFKRQNILLKESLSKINYINASTFFINNGIKGSENTEKIAKYKNIIEKFITLGTN